MTSVEVLGSETYLRCLGKGKRDDGILQSPNHEDRKGHSGDQEESKHEMLFFLDQHQAATPFICFIPS